MIEKHNVWLQKLSGKWLGTASKSSVQHRALHRNTPPGGYQIQSYSKAYITIQLTHIYIILAQKSQHRSVPDLTDAILQGQALYYYIPITAGRQMYYHFAIQPQRTALHRIIEIQERGIELAHMPMLHITEWHEHILTLCWVVVFFSLFFFFFPNLVQLKC